MILVSRFIAEAIAEVANDENIFMDNDELIKVRVIPCQLNLDEIESYVSQQLGDKQLAKNDVKDTFSKIDLSSKSAIIIRWDS